MAKVKFYISPLDDYFNCSLDIYVVHDTGVYRTVDPPNSGTEFDGPLAGWYLTGFTSYEVLETFDCIGTL